MKRFQLGEFEEIVLLTAGILFGDAFALAIRQEIESRLKRKVSIGALHTALLRLEEKGYLKSFFKEGDAIRAGRPSKYYEITTLGLKALEYTQSTRNDLWKSIPKNLWNIKKA
ncbi:MAG: helix-turn-helix transcriptional regulator [Chitinophagaceae bacterium]